MAWKTVNGTTAANAGPSGLREFAAGDTLNASDLLRDMRDPQDALGYQTLPGVMAGGVCTCSGLTVTIPSGTVVYCRSIWTADGDMTQTVSDGTTSYVWLCSDGETRVTADTTPPTGYDERSACILCRVIASGGIGTVDLSAQQRARYAVGRYVNEGAGVLAAVPDMIPDGGFGEVSNATQLRLMDQLSVYGSLRTIGKVRIE